MIKIDIEKFIKDRAWLGYYWTGTIFKRDLHPAYWCKLRTPGKEWCTGVVIREWKAW